LLAGAVGGLPEFEVVLREAERFRRRVPREAEERESDDAGSRWEALRQAVAFADRVTAYELVMPRMWSAPHTSPARLYQAMVGAYRDGDWEAALSLARQTEMCSPPGTIPIARVLSRALAAEICSIKGDNDRAVAWLDGVPAAAVPPVVSWARCGVRYLAGETTEACQDGWRDYRSLRESGFLVGTERLLRRLGWLAAREGDAELLEQALREAEELHRNLGSAASGEAMLFLRSVAREDAAAAVEAHSLAVQRGDQYLVLVNCLQLAAIGDDPALWLNEARDLSERLSALDARRLLNHTAHRRGVPLPRRRAPRPVLGETERNVIQMVSDGSTNRQIAGSLGCSEKTVEDYLTRIFARTGCRSRVALAAGWLDGSLAQLSQPVPTAITELRAPY
jgi:DNA-binding CsgD family transcriptional regulator